MANMAKKKTPAEARKKKRERNERRKQQRKLQSKPIRVAEDLHEDVTTNILSRLPLQTLLECRRVCRTWRTRIEDPMFLKAHVAAYRANKDHSLDTYGFFVLANPFRKNADRFYYGECYNDEAARFKFTRKYVSNHPFKEDVNWRIVGSCNGLICLSSNDVKDDVYVYNPLTGEYVEIPRFGGAGDYAKGYFVSGFGCHDFTKEFKVVRIFYDGKRDSGNVKMYTLGSGGWRSVGEVPYMLHNSRRSGVLVNGALHWLMNDDEIVAFSLVDEKFRIVPSPVYPPEPEPPTPTEDDYGPIITYNPTPRHFIFRIGFLGRCLCATVSDFDNQKTSIWVMEMYMKQESWTKKMTVKTLVGYCHLQPLALSEFGALSCLNETTTICSFDLYAAGDEPTLTVKDLRSLLKIKKPAPHHFEQIHYPKYIKKLEMIPYVKSFISLKAMGEDNAKFYRATGARVLS